MHAQAHIRPGAFAHALLCFLVCAAQVIDVESRLAQTQRAALQAGRSTALKWEYNAKDEMMGAFCDGVWFGRDELMALSTLSTL